MNQIQSIPFPYSKRLFDLAASLILVIVLSPLWIAICLAMLIEFALSSGARGGIFYKETRISQGRPFMLYKFRVFKREAIQSYLKTHETIQTKELEHDQTTLTAVGRLLRQAYLDELPQLWCVLKGDMSLVGPRPTNVENYQRKLAMGNQAKRLLKAGITGYFQSHKGLALRQNQEVLDMEYARFLTSQPGWKIILFDLRILLISIKTVFRAEGI